VFRIHKSLRADPDLDPDPGVYLNAEPDLDPDPGVYLNADPDSRFWIQDPDPMSFLPKNLNKWNFFSMSSFSSTFITF